MATITVTKRYIISSVNGADELFQLPEAYIEGTLWTFVVASNGNASLRTNEYFDGGFFKITPAPAANSSIYAIYDIHEISNTDPANFVVDGITVSNIVDILNVIRVHGETLKLIDKAIQNKVGTFQFAQFADAINNRIKVLEIS